ncbi:hypothetical protein CYMTET_8481 [Cymbomonas tetramitiformis]|uniref:Uncharacterized protein n=1 Tax=Cymbomonas tetramitiformis TaxID=36881 RepID=A0AAE0GSZ1_9CHLO|nr:hypothetical protein CYMTET_8481 [Cymbomonas tetramitiformis]
MHRIANPNNPVDKPDQSYIQGPIAFVLKDHQDYFSMKVTWFKLGSGQNAQSTPLTEAGRRAGKRQRMWETAESGAALAAAKVEADALARCDRVKRRRALLEDIEE